MNSSAVSFHVRISRALFGRQYRHLKLLRTREIDGYSLAPFDRYRCIFVHIPKAAGVSVSRKLFGCLGGGHAPLADYAGVFSPHEFNTYFKFTIVRNPWDRLLSAFVFLKKGGFNQEDARWSSKHLSSYSDFNTFVKGWVNRKSVWTKQHFYPQSYFVELNGKINVDYVGRFENINEDFAVVARRLGIEGELDHLNGTGKKNYRDYYDKESGEIVADVYRDDIALFDYRF